MTALNFAAENRSTVIVAGGALVIFGALGFVLTHSSRPQPAPPPPPPVLVMIQPQKPPPPPPQQKIITPPKMTTPAMKPVVNTPPKAPSPSHVGTSIHGNGPNAFDLSGTPGGMGFGDGDGGAGSAMSYYESQLQTQIQDALEKNPITRKFSGTVQLHISVDANGAVTAVQLDKSTGNPAVDAALTDNVLTSMHFPAPPNGTADTFPMSLTAEQPL
jgi:TonB family protein